MGATLANQSIAQFLAGLASSAPTPGGGAAAALVGAVAAALGGKACALTLGKARFADVEPRVREIAASLARANEAFTRLMDEDAAAYADLSAAYKLDKSDPQRPARVTGAAALAATVPLETLALARRVREELRGLHLLANPQLASDVECGVFLAEAAMRAAEINVRVNLPSAAPELRRRLERELEQLAVHGPRDREA